MQNRTDKIRAAIVVALTLSTLAVYAMVRHAGPAEKARAEAIQRSAKAQPAPRNARGPEAKPTPAPTPISASGGQVSLSAALDRSSVLVDSDGLVHVALTLRADPNAEAVAAQPTDALVVLDISGSMSGQKLDYAKQALHQLIDRLTTRDRFGLVTYESEAQLLQPLTRADGANVAHFHRVVNELETAGGTNMSAGLDLALRQLRQRERAGAGARVLLLSDGHANEGDSSADGLMARARRVTQQDDVLSALGIGDDFNEDLMTGLAETGTGNFYYLSRVETLGSFFDAELAAASQTVASALELAFSPAAGVKLLELSGYPLQSDGADTTVRPGNLIAGQERVLWATLKVPTDTLRDLQLGSFALRFKKDDTAYELRAAALPALACVTDAARFEASIVPALWEQYTLTEQYTKAEGAIGRAIAEGDAKDIDREQRAFESNRALASKLGSSAVLKKLDDMWAVASSAKQKQLAAPSERAYHAKQQKSRALFDRRRDAYNSDPLSGL
jgi:Ca-activated chloride channel family protein